MTRKEDRGEEDEEEENDNKRGGTTYTQVGPTSSGIPLSLGA